MNGLRTRIYLDSHLQKVHNETAHAGDRAAMIGAVIIGAIYVALLVFGVVP